MIVHLIAAAAAQETTTAAPRKPLQHCRKYRKTWNN